jgi:putative endonuclease
LKSNSYYVYLITNKNNSTIYTGVTNDLVRRIYEYKHRLADGFTKRYNVDKLVYYETTEDVESAISREKQLKAGSRQKKIDLINRDNPEWNELEL